MSDASCRPTHIATTICCETLIWLEKLYSLVFANISTSVETKNVARAEKKNTNMEFEAKAAVICGLIVALLMLDFEILKKRVGKLTHHAIFRSV